VRSASLDSVTETPLIVDAHLISHTDTHLPARLSHRLPPRRRFPAIPSGRPPLPSTRNPTTPTHLHVPACRRSGRAGFRAGCRVGIEPGADRRGRRDRAQAQDKIRHRLLSGCNDPVTGKMTTTSAGSERDFAPARETPSEDEPLPQVPRWAASVWESRAVPPRSSVTRLSPGERSIFV